jgi:alkylated DNA repair dioxygenase AlkB
MTLIINDINYEYHKDFLLPQDELFLKQKLTSVPWRQVKYFKKHRGKIVTPRLSWVSGGLSTTVNKHPNWILPLLQYAKETFHEEFNYILYFKYDSPKHSISPHSDNEFFLGPNPKIAVLTIGDSIKFKLINKITRQKICFNFQSNDLILMKANCQKELLHTVPKDKTFVNKTRYSLSFRKVIHPYGDLNYNKYN